MTSHVASGGHRVRASPSLSGQVRVRASPSLRGQERVPANFFVTESGFEMCVRRDPRQAKHISNSDVAPF